MRLTLALLTVTLGACSLAACSKEPEASYNYANDAAPDIAPSAAPNVAFTYAYRFALAPREIASVQEKHAAACEALGLARCRITGVIYRRSGEEAIEAELALKLAPDIARKFGRDASAVVDAAKGTLSELEIGGQDQSEALEASQDDIAAAQSERERLERALADRATSASLRAQLSTQLTAQREAETRAAREGRNARALVAATPMHFTYSTDGYAPGFSLDGTARGALSVAATLLNGLLAVLIVLLALAIPVGLLLLALAHGQRGVQWLWKRLGPKPHAEAS